MTLVGRLHPLIGHFPIALVMIAAVFEGGSIATGDRRWHASSPSLDIREDCSYGALFSCASNGGTRGTH